MGILSLQSDEVPKSQVFLSKKCSKQLMSNGRYVLWIAEPIKLVYQ